MSDAQMPARVAATQPDPYAGLKKANRWILATFCPSTRRIVLTASAILLLLYGVAPAIAIWIGGGVAKAGTFGDTYGFINAFVSGLALFTVAVTLILQKRQLSVQEQELQANTNALEEQKDEFVKQVELMREQSFDTRFFQLLRLLQTITDAIEVKHGQTYQRETGRIAFEVMYRNSLKGVGENSAHRIDRAVTPDEMTKEERLEDIAKQYGYFHDIHCNILGHFFRTLYHIVRYIDNAAIPDDGKHFYTRLVRAQLSEHQLLLLFYNCLVEGLGYPKFYGLVEKYDLLQNMGRSELLASRDTRFYPSLSGTLGDEGKSGAAAVEDKS